MWIIEPIQNKAFALKWGPDLEDTNRYDPYEFSCIVEDVGDGIALIGNASGFPVIDRQSLREKLIALGFKEVRWVRVVSKKLVTDTGG